MTAQQKLESFKARLGEDATPAQIIQAAVCAAFQIEIGELFYKSNQFEFSHPRLASMYFCRSKLGMTYMAIAKAHGKKDHCTPFYAMKRIGGLKTDPTFKWAFDRAERLLKSTAETAVKGIL